MMERECVIFWNIENDARLIVLSNDMKKAEEEFSSIAKDREKWIVERATFSA